MQVQYIKEYSNCLDREMEYKIYGQGVSCVWLFQVKMDVSLNGKIEA